MKFAAIRTSMPLQKRSSATDARPAVEIKPTGFPQLGHSQTSEKRAVESACRIVSTAIIQRATLRATTLELHRQSATGLPHFHSCRGDLSTDRKPRSATARKQAKHPDSALLQLILHFFEAGSDALIVDPGRARHADAADNLVADLDGLAAGNGNDVRQGYLLMRH